MEETDVVWRSKLDGKYDVYVERTDDYTGVLKIAMGEEVLHSEEVALAYGALFGPDVDDVADWQERAVRVVDHRICD
ncbi:MAG: hypothetical protein AB1425_01495 [Actinomycetota bacterium]